RLEKVEELTEAVEAKKKELAQLANPSPQDLKRARTLERERERLQGRLEAAGLSLSLKASAPLKGGFAADGRRKSSFQVGAGDEKAFAAAREALITLEGVGTLHVSSGAGETAALEKKLGQVEEELRGVLQGY